MKEAPYLDHENLDVYRCAIDFLAMATRLGAALPRGEGEFARGSALECGAILDVAVATGVLDPTPVGNAKMLLTRIVAMLTKMTFA